MRGKYCFVKSYYVNAYGRNVFCNKPCDLTKISERDNRSGLSQKRWIPFVVGIRFRYYHFMNVPYGFYSSAKCWKRSVYPVYVWVVIHQISTLSRNLTKPKSLCGQLKWLSSRLFQLFFCLQSLFPAKKNSPARDALERTSRPLPTQVMTPAWYCQPTVLF